MVKIKLTGRIESRMGREMRLIYLKEQKVSSYKEQEIVESHDRPRPGTTRRIKEAEVKI